MAGRNRWADMKARRFPEVVNARFPEGTKARIDAIARAESARLMEGEYAVNVNESMIVRRAVLDFLDAWEARA